MADIFPPVVQRPKLLAFRRAIDARASCLRRDECGDWAVCGRGGHIFAVPEGFQLLCFKGSVRGWNAAKSRLGFCSITQDGDEEGGLILDRLPTASEAEAIRYVLGIPKARHLSEEQRARMILSGAWDRFKGDFRPKSGSGGG